jgi:prepilin-type N-terminal cleavage/methylation domain-containing protein
MGVVQKSSSRQSGYTLTELLVAMSITAIVLTLIAQPIIQTHKMVSGAQGEANAQSLSRNLLERIVNEISNSTGVLRSDGLIAVSIPTNYDQPERSYREVLLEGAKVDFFKPAQRDDSPDPSRGFYNAEIGRYDPTLQAPRGDLVLPASPGLTLVRYFIGLKEPLQIPSNPALYEQYKPGLYRNPYRSPLMRPMGSGDNLYVLYRAEVQPYVYERGRLVVNTTYFAEDPRERGKPLLEDPYFFMLRSSDTDKEEKVRRILAWKRRAVIVTEVSRYDMIAPVVDRGSGRVVRRRGVPLIRGLVQFKPGTVQGEVARPMQARHLGDEGAYSERYAPEVYMTSRGGWNSVSVRLRPARQVKMPSGQVESHRWRRGEPYVVGRSVRGDDPLGLSVFSMDASQEEGGAGLELFSVQRYWNATSPYRFSAALAFDPLVEGSQVYRDRFAAFVVDPKEGKILTSFPISEVGNVHAAPLADNKPFCLTGDLRFEENLVQGSSQSQVSLLENPLAPINHRFLVLWHLEERFSREAQGLSGIRGTPMGTRIFRLDRSQYAKRFVDLRRIPCRDGTPSPLDPQRGFAKARIVPGSEVIIGPDQLAPEGVVRYVRYQRTVSRPVGPNQYLINYGPQNEPENLEALIFQPNFAEAGLKEALLENVFRARYKTGYVEFCSDYGRPLPEGEVTLFYRFQFADPKDLFLVDYTSSNVLSVYLTIQGYPAAELPAPQIVSLSGTAIVRNFVR